MRGEAGGAPPWLVDVMMRPPEWLVAATVLAIVGLVVGAAWVARDGLTTADVEEASATLFTMTGCAVGAYVLAGSGTSWTVAVVGGWAIGGVSVAAILFVLDYTLGSDDSGPTGRGNSADTSDK